MDKVSNNIQEYAEAIYALTRNSQPASVKSISEKLSVAPPSVTEMLKKLNERGLVKYSPYHGAELTPEGLKLGAGISRKHRLLEYFLHNVLNLSKESVHQQACEMEHALSDEAEVALCRYLGHPSECPDDKKPIQPCDLQVSSCDECMSHQGQPVEQVGKRNQNLVSLTDVKDGHAGKVAFIRGGNQVLRRLLDMGLTPGTEVGVVRAAPLKGPVEVSVRGSRLAIGHGIATNIFLEVGG